MNRAWQCILATLLSSLICCSAVASERPNIIVFLIDDMGLMDTSVPMLNGKDGQPERFPLNEFYHTPNMERLAESGIRFSHFYAQSVCSPTRVSFLTGQNAPRHHVTQWIHPAIRLEETYAPKEWRSAGLSSADVTLSGLLQKSGYRTLIVGKGHLGQWNHEGADPLNLGFDINIGAQALGCPPSYYAKNAFGTTGKGTNHALPNLEKYHGQDMFLTEALAREANALIEHSVKDETPFFLYFPHYAVHSPFDSDPRFTKRYASSKHPGPGKAFATMIEGADKSLGDVMDKLEALGIAEDTLIIFTGDNGTDSPIAPGKDRTHGPSAPLRGKKGTEYEGGTRVPFIASWGKEQSKNPWQKKLPIAAGKLQNQLGTIMDLYPTLLELTGIENPPGHIIDGHSLKTQFTNRHNPERPSRFLLHFPHPHRGDYFTSLVLDDWKLIYYYNPQTPNDPSVDLYNLARDPYETKNLAATEPKKAKEMIEEIIAELKACNAQYVIDPKGEEIRPRTFDGLTLQQPSD